MSYLDPPRFSFFGTFKATPSTINNSTPNYDPGTQFNNNPPSASNVNSVSWNPGGWAFFQVLSGTVSGAVMTLGTTITSNDTIIGANIVSVPSGTAQPYHQGRIVDLDPDQQNRSMVVGLKLQITTTDGVTLSGVVAPMTIIDLWGRIQGGNAGGIQSAGAMYQSVIQDVTWTGIENTSSAFLKALYDASPDTLSIKFNVDGYNGLGPQFPGFGTGRIAGTIGPYGELAAGVPEPMHVLAQRRMYGTIPTGTAAAVSPYYDANNPSPLNPAPFQVRNGYLTIDLGNSIPTVAASTGLAGPFLDLGTVEVVINPGDSSATTLPALFGTPDEFAANYVAFAGIYDVPLNANAADGVALGLQINSPSATGPMLTPRQVTQAKMGKVVPLTATSAPAPAGATIALAENSGGQFASFDFNALRLANGAPAWSSAALTGTEITSNAEVPFYATVFGEPAANQTFNVQTAFNPNGSAASPAWVSNDPSSAITPAPSSVTPPSNAPPNIATITTDANGVGTFTVTANDLSEAGLQSAQDGWRAALDSQCYLYSHDWTMDTVGQPLTFLLFVNTPGPSQPTWTNDISPIFEQYAAVYPGMKQVLDLSNYGVVKANLQAFKTVMNLPMTDPSHMPVTRDLSPARLAMINAWFKDPQQ
jgi:hypothetical protein